MTLDGSWLPVLSESGVAVSGRFDRAEPGRSMVWTNFRRSRILQLVVSEELWSEGRLTSREAMLGRSSLAWLRWEKMT